MREGDAELRDIHHHDHRSGQREAFWVLVLICGGGFYLLFQSGLEGFFFYLVGIVIATIGATAAFLTMKWVSGIESGERAVLAEEQREASRLEREKQLAEYRARNVASQDPRKMPRQEVIE